MTDSAAETYRNARREARFVIVLWFLALVWTVGYCYLRGYHHAPDSWVVQAGLAEAGLPEKVHFVFGLPSWITYGILAPWLICSIITVWFGLYYMRDDDLGVDREEPPHA
jgi:hypothetical protein